MKVKLLHEDDGQRTFALVFDSGDSVLDLLRAFATQEKLSGAQFTAIGAFSAVSAGLFRLGEEGLCRARLCRTGRGRLADRRRRPRARRRPAIHVHCVLGRSDYSALAGHLLKATVRPTLELVLTESPVHHRKKNKATSGLALIDLDSSPE